MKIVKSIYDLSKSDIKSILNGENFVDQTSVELQKNICEREVRIANKKCFSLLCSNIDKHLDVPDCDELVAQAATDWLIDIETVISSLIKRIAKTQDQYKLLYFTRRLPSHCWLGDSKGITASIRQISLDIVGGKFGRNYPQQEPMAENIRFSFGPKFRRTFLLLGSLVTILCQVHANIRRAGKGAIFKFTNQTIPPIPEATTTGPLERAIQLYDFRLEGPRWGSSRTGIGRNVGKESEDCRNKDIEVLHVGADTGTTKNPMDAPYACGFLTSEELHETCRFDWILDIKRSRRIGILLQIMTVVAKSLSANSFVNLRLTGYVVTSKRFWERVKRNFDTRTEKLRDAFPSLGYASDVSELLQEVNGWDCAVFPCRPGPVIRLTTKKVIIDYLMATQRFYYEISLAGLTGEFANRRAQEFEDNTQSMIDGTTWRPGEELRTVKGRHISFAKKTITDIDAIGACKDKVMLVSCKSSPYTDDYDKGLYKAVRNLRTNAEEAWDKWQSVVAFVREHPNGDNYDFSGYNEIFGVVCYPFPPYLEIGPATSEVRPGLRAVASIGELQDWLEKRSAAARRTSN